MSMVHHGSVQRFASFDDYFRADYTGLMAHAVKQMPYTEAEDAVQQTLIDVYRHWDAIEAPKAYARRAIDRSAADCRRRNGKSAEQIERIKQLLREESIESAAAMVEFDAEVRYVLGLLHALPADRREVMAWYLDGYKPAEIAAHTGRNPATVRSHLRNAIKSLKGMIENDSRHATIRKE